MTILNWLNGKKTLLGLCALAVYYAGLQFNLYQPDATVEGLILTWTGVGLAHRVAKG